MDTWPLMQADPGESQRLAKRVAALVPCSRSQAERYITQGWVRVDGQVSDTPEARVRAGQSVEVDPQARLQATVMATFLIHKPAGLPCQTLGDLLTPSKHWRGDTSGLRRVKGHLNGLQLLMPMPHQASGLCVLSQDMRVIRKLTQDATLVEQELIADVAGDIATDGLTRLCQGLQHRGQQLPPARVSWQSETRLRFAVKGIAPEWIEGMCDQVGLQLLALRRIRIGRIPMAGLPAGQWCHLPMGARF